MNFRRTFSQIALVAGALLFSAGLQAFAFTQPTTSPPNADAYAPLHTGPTAQSKVGGLLLNTGGAANGLIVQLGNVGIGTTNPAVKLDVSGGVKIGSESTCNASTEGTQRYNATAKLMEFCNGTYWKAFSPRQCLENENCSGTVSLCAALSPDSNSSVIPDAAHPISYGPWSNDQCGISGTGWHVGGYSSCSSGAGTLIARCQWVMVQ